MLPPHPVRIAATAISAERFGTRDLEVHLQARKPQRRLRAPGVRPRVVIDPGHGGRDPGAVTEELAEAPLVLDVGLRMVAMLRASDRLVPIISRTADLSVALQERLRPPPGPQPGALISLHADARVAAPGRGAAIYTGAAGRGLALPLAAAITQAGLAADSVPVRRALFAVLAGAIQPAALVELGFLTDSGDRARLAAPGWRYFMARALADGLLAWEAAVHVPARSDGAN